VAKRCVFRRRLKVPNVSDAGWQSVPVHRAQTAQTETADRRQTRDEIAMQIAERDVVLFS